MTRQYQKYDKIEVAALIQECQSYTEVLRRLGKSPRGGSVTNLKRMCVRWGIDISGITGFNAQRGQPSFKRKPAGDLLVLGTPADHRVAADRLRRSLFELGVEHKCVSCGIDEWNGQKLVLEIDHIDGQYWNNQQSNLQFLCPNCHSLKKV